VTTPSRALGAGSRRLAVGGEKTKQGGKDVNELRQALGFPAINDLETK